MNINKVMIGIGLLTLLSCGYPHEYRPLLELVRSDVRGMEIILSAGSITEGESARAIALIITAGGRKREAAGALWESLDPEVLSVDQAGVITGLAAGRGRVSAVLRGLSAAGEVDVIRRVDYGRIRICEVFYDAEGADDGREFIELCNGNDYDADVSGMMVTDGAPSSGPFEFPAGSLIGANGRVTVAQSGEGFYQLFARYPDFDAFTFTLNNSGETLLLMKPDGAVIDAVYIKGGTGDFAPGEAWGSPLLPAAPSGSSVHRTGPVDTDAFSDWAEGPPSPGE